MIDSEIEKRGKEALARWSASRPPPPTEPERGADDPGPPEPDEPDQPRSTQYNGSHIFPQREKGSDTKSDPLRPPWTTRSSVVPEIATDGGCFVFEQPKGIECLWGRGAQVLWPAGEAFMIAGGQGLCKTTIAGLLLRGLIGLGPGKILELPVIDTGCKILYLAMDRPKQIARSMGRQFTTKEDRQVLSERVIVRQGPPPRDLAAAPLLLAQMAEYYDAGIVFVDSLKDAAVGLKEDEVGARYNRARQHLLAQGVELIELHHSVKHNANQVASPISIDRIYGSTWLTSGCGSVVLLTGDPGDPIIGFHHVKQPAELIGPYRLMHDQIAGELSIEHSVDLIALAKAAGVEGLTAKAAAAATTEKANPNRAEVEKSRRKLEQMAAAGLLVRVDGEPRPDGGRPTAAWFLAERTNHAPITESDKPAGPANHATFDDLTNHATVTPITRNNETAGEDQSRDLSRQSRASQSRFHTPL